MTNKNQKIRVNITIDPDLKTTLDEMAEQQNRTFSNMVEYILKQELENDDL